MASIAEGVRRSAAPDLDKGLGRPGVWGFGLAVAGAIAFVAWSIYHDAAQAGVHATAILPFAMLFLALLIALAFEFVNGFHDTANAVATVIYTHSLPAHLAVVWSGFFNFLGVLLSSGAVAFSVVSLLPVELILKVGSDAGFAMVFALLFAAIIWNLATWYWGIPNSSSHTLVGSIIGVGLCNALLHGRAGTTGVDWTQARSIGYALLLSPALGFILSALLFLALRLVVRNEALFREPDQAGPPPWWIRGLLIFTCTGVSFAHGSNDGQKGMGLIMLILIGTVPTAYALNRAVPAQYEQQFHAGSRSAVAALHQVDGGAAAPADARGVVVAYLADRKATPATVPALGVLVQEIDHQVAEYGSLRQVPAAASKNMRNDMYLASEAIKHLTGGDHPRITGAPAGPLGAYKGLLDKATRFIPTWVKMAVALALGLGTMVGWKRIVVTVGERIGKSHLTYAQGASAELVAMATIGLADGFGMPVSTTHVLSSGVAGTMAASRAGLQMATVRNLVAAWLVTLPVAMLLAGTLFFLFSRLI
ncbi:inorganic phosphate transporter [Sphingomonas morindae]|uniref:Phosphate transporter n=1 Tax=Sphingomonas morindae TaxID=1541170 RepID=A0ABY4X5B7_9SPHN|nr:inorganic phosphate transporter [Sphingomonas morindae]USI72069.1 inorganic phosphate transporter [Sphingomonas morindae]